MTDNYRGWVKKILSSLPNFTHVISAIRSLVLEKPDVKSDTITFLPIRSKVSVIETNEKWAKIFLSSKNKRQHGYILLSHCLEKNFKINEWVNYLEIFKGVPYRWGGRSSLAIDCSALLQLSYSFSDIILPRDSKEQLEYFKMAQNYVTNKTNNFDIQLSRGNIIFWTGHVAIMFDNKNIIHASGHHGSVIIENLKIALNRIKKEFTYCIKSV